MHFYENMVVFAGTIDYYANKIYNNIVVKI